MEAHTKNNSILIIKPIEAGSEQKKHTFKPNETYFKRKGKLIVLANN